MNSISNVTVVVRSVYERTESACYNLILEQGVSERDIFIIHETPFSAALHRSYSIGIEQNKKWTLCLDADVLLRSGIISEIVQLAEKMPEHVFETQGMILDYLFGGPKEGGIHLYRTTLLPIAILFTKEAEFKLRPENFILLKMKSEGYPFQRLNLVVGLHDFDQFYRDIFRKSFVHATKHLRHLPYLIPYWKEMTANSNDFNVALAGLSAGIESNEEVTIDSKLSYILHKFEQLGLSEKTASENSWSVSRVEETINNWNGNIYFNTHLSKVPNYLYDVEKYNWFLHLKSSIKTKPLHKRPSYIAGKIFKRLSRNLLKE